MSHRPKREACLRLAFAIAAASALLLTSCSDRGDDAGGAGAAGGGDTAGGADGAASLDDLRGADGAACPLSLARGLDAAGIDADGDTDVTIEVGDAGSPLAAADGVLVDCSVDTPSGRVRALLVAVGGTDGPDAVGVLLPVLGRDLEASTAELESVVASVGADGELVDLPGQAAAALVPVDVDGADDAVVFVFAEQGLSRRQAEGIAAEIAGDL